MPDGIRSMSGGDMKAAAKGRAILLLGHGSSKNAASSEPTRALARRLEGTGNFDEVVCGFWKEEPKMREVLDGLSAKEVVIVPYFTVEGYFVRRVIPEALELTGRVTRRATGQVLRYCRAVGSHSRMPEIVLERACEIAPGVNLAETTLLVAGHGTLRDAQSSESVNAVVAALRERNIFREVYGVFLEVAPRIEDWKDVSESAKTIVVPFFISDGLHGGVDVPSLLGIDKAERIGVHTIGDRELYYSRAVGTDEAMVDVVLDLIREASREGV